jgi:hypothetical protein
MHAVQTILLECPHCWEQVELVVDCLVAEQEFVEDCSVCCSPMVVMVSVGDDDELHAETRMENG